jgi:uncharacterized protein
MKAFLLVLLTLVPFLSKGSDVYPKPIPFKYLNLFLNHPRIFISESDEQELENKLAMLSSQGKGEVIVVVVENIGKNEAWNVATDLGQEWGIGEQGKDNGVVVLIRPFGEAGKRFVHIAVGYGVEDKLTDANSSKIVNDIMIPRFSKGLYRKGLNEGLNAIAMSLGMKDENGRIITEKRLNKKRHDPLQIVLAIIFGTGILIGLGIFISILSKWLGRITLTSKGTSSNSSSTSRNTRTSSSNQSSRKGGGQFGGGGAGGTW